MPLGKAVCLASGLALTTTYATRTLNVQNFAKTTIAFESVKGNSGAGYYIHGYPKIGFPAYTIIGSGTVTVSGSYTILTSGFDDAYEELKIGVKGLTSGFCGAMTVTASRRRR